MKPEPEQELCDSWSIGRLRPWLQMVAEHEMPDALRGRLEASDLVQQTLLKAWQGAAGLSAANHAERLAWLRTIMKNTIRDQQRAALAGKRGHGNVRLASEVFVDPAATIGQHAVAPPAAASTELIAAETAAELAEAIGQLPELQRRVIELRHYDELSHAEIAVRLNKSESAVRMLWVRALRNLKHN